jgi:hypothetical protein
VEVIRQKTALNSRSKTRLLRETFLGIVAAPFEEQPEGTLFIVGSTPFWSM